MTNPVHDIRLAAGFEIPAQSVATRTLSRSQAEQLAAALAADLARTVADADQSMFVLSGSVFEPGQLLRPGLPVWQALFDAAAPLIREQGLAPQLLAIGSHQGRLPDRRLSPPDDLLQSQFVAIPILLITDPVAGPDLEAELERELFERGSIDPPARALLHDSLGLDSVHGQLLTATDLLALQHVQMDAAGFGSFWPVVEHALLSPNQALEFELAAGLKAQWRPDEQVLSVEFRDFGSLENADEEAYRLWQRALRTLTALCGSHGLQWQPRPTDGDRIERDGRLIISTVGPTHAPDGAARHIDEDIGLIAWSVVENGFLKHIYPLDAGTARDVERSLREKFSDLSTLTLAELKT